MTIISATALRGSTQSAFDDFLEAYPAYMRTGVLDELRSRECECMGDRGLGAVRVSLGMASNFADVHRCVQFIADTNRD